MAANISEVNPLTSSKHMAKASPKAKVKVVLVVIALLYLSEQLVMMVQLLSLGVMGLTPKILDK